MPKSKLNMIKKSCWNFGNVNGYKEDGSHHVTSQISIKRIRFWRLEKRIQNISQNFKGIAAVICTKFAINLNCHNCSSLKVKDKFDVCGTNEKISSPTIREINSLCLTFFIACLLAILCAQFIALHCTFETVCENMFKWNIRWTKSNEKDLMLMSRDMSIPSRLKNRKSTQFGNIQTKKRFLQIYYFNCWETWWRWALCEARAKTIIKFSFRTDWNWNNE